VLAVFGDVMSTDVRTSIAATRALPLMFGVRQAEIVDVAFGSAMMVPPQVRLAMFSRLLDNDDVLATVDVPTLVVHGGRDAIVRLSAAEHIAGMVPGVRSDC
jgi:non-heme chloroperoxidase